MNRKTASPARLFVPARLRVVSSISALQKADALVLFLTDNLAAGMPPNFPHKSLVQQMIRVVGESKEFRGKANETAVLHTWGKLPWPRVLLVGLGKAKDLGRSGLSRAGGAASRRAGKSGCRSVAIWLPAIPSGPLPLATLAQTIAEGMLVGSYTFDRFKTRSPDDSTRRLTQVLLGVEARELRGVQAAIQAGERLAGAVNYAREIANLPGNVIYPEKLADEAVKLGRQHKMRITVWNRARLEREKFGGLIAVGAGSVREPRFIRIDYNRHAATGVRQSPIVLVGKAITFDSGGISIKPSDKMDEMKFDKCGGVAVLGIMRAIAELRLPVPVIGLIASAENMPSATSYRPGDIVTTYSGKTIEVLNTDAEGRIVLGDALAYAEQLKPQAIVDFATLTGACVVALGPHAAGLFSNNQKLSDRLRSAADSTGERVWPFPLWDEYHDMIKSPVADVKNTGGRYGGAITAAAFLQKFVGKSPWAHLDIAGTAWTTDEKPYLARGGTAYGVRLIVEMLRNWKPMGS